MEKEFENYPTLDEVLISIEKIKKNGFPTFKENESVENYVKEISDFLTNEFKILPNFLTVSNLEKFPLNLFRVREYDSFTNINLFSEHSYPPIDYVKLGRCNFPNYPVFYCSNNPLVALMEVVRSNKGENKKYCISKWEIIKSKDEFAFQSFLQSKQSKEDGFYALNGVIKNRINEPFENKLSKEQIDGLLEYLKFLDDSFIKDGNYLLSASIAHRTLYPKHNLPTDILMYPSIQTNFAGFNMAVHPNFINNNVAVKRFYIVEFESYSDINNSVNLKFLKYGDVKKNTII